MTFSQFLSILRARRLVAIGVFVAVVLISIVGSLLWPPQYEGSASVVVDAKPDPVSAMAYPGMAIGSLIATQVDIINSDRVALRVIRELKLTESPEIRAQWQDDTDGEGTIENWLIGVLHKRLDVKPSRESNVIGITYQAPDPRFAATLANAFAQAYIATTLELRVNPARQFTNFFDVQAKEAREALERAQAKLTSFQRNKGIVATDERLDVESARLSELSSQLVQLQAIASESSSRQAQAQGRSGDRIQEVLNNPLVINIKADVTRAESRLQELSAKYGDNHPQVIEAKASLAELRSRLNAEVQRVGGGVSVTNTINQQREAQVRRQLEDQRSQLLRMKAVRDEGMVLVREVENAQRTYDTLMGRLTQTALESQTTQSFANILTIADPPAKPSSPKILLNVALGFFLGLLLAICVVLIKELRDRRVRAPEDVVAVIGLPIIGVLPKPTAKRHGAGRRALAMQQRVLGLPSSPGSSRA